MGPEARRKREEAARREAEARKAAILQASLDAIVTIDAESRIVEWNSAAERIFGWTAQEAIGRDLPDLIIPPRYREAHRQGLHRYLQTGQGPALGRRLELPALRRDGAEFPSELSIVPLQAGARPLFTGFLRDVTDQKRAEAALRESEERFRRLFASNPLPTWVFDAETHRFLDVNEVTVEKYGHSREEFLRLRVMDLRPDEDAPRFVEHLRQHPPGPLHSVGWRHRLKDGRIIDVEAATHRIDHGGRPAFLAVIHDVTERRRAHLELAASEERFRALDEHSPTMYFTVGVDGVILSANRFGAGYLGYAPAELVGRPAWELYHPDDREQARANHLAFLARPPPPGEVREWEGRKVTKQGVPIRVREALTRLPTTDGAPVALVACFDVTAQRRAAAELETSRRALTNLLESITDAFFALDRDWRFTYLNREAERITHAAMGRSRENLLGRILWDALPGARGTEFERHARRVMEERTPARFEAWFPPFGIRFDVHAYPTGHGISVLFRDATAGKRREHAEGRQEAE